MKTAVEWLVENIREKGLVAALWNEKVFEQAKEMEKQHLNNAYNDDRPNLTCYEENTAFNDYYNKTFKK